MVNSQRKILDLNDRVDEMIDEETLVKQNHTLRYETTIRDLEERLKKTIQNEEAVFRTINDHLSKIDQVLAQQKATRELLEEKKRKELKVAESNVNLQVSWSVRHRDQGF